MSSIPPPASTPSPAPASQKRTSGERSVRQAALWGSVVVVLLGLLWWTTASDEGSDAPVVAPNVSPHSSVVVPVVETPPLKNLALERPGVEKSAEQLRREELAREIVRRRGAHAFGGERLQPRPVGSQPAATSSAPVESSN